MNNHLLLKFSAISENEQFARSAVAAFAVSLNPSIEEINDIKTAVSEAVTNAVVHAYPDNDNGEITIDVKIFDKIMSISIIDEGVGIPDIRLAMKPFYTTKPFEERSGMGFAVMQALCDDVVVEHNNEKGIKVTLIKKIA